MAWISRTLSLLRRMASRDWNWYATGESALAGIADSSLDPEGTPAPIPPSLGSG